MTRSAWAATGLIGIALITGTLSDTAPSRTPLMAGGYRVIAADFHVHTFPLAASTIAPWDVAAEAERKGLDAIVVSGHNETISGKAAKWWRRSGGPTVIAGEEIHGPKFHMIAAGIHSTIDWRVSAAEAIDEVHRQGGVAIAAHPARPLWPAFDRIAMEKLDAAEVVHPLIYGHEEFRDAFEQFYARGGVAPIGSSDFHGVGPMGVCRTYVFVRDDSEQAILEAIRARRTVVMDRGRAYGDPALVELARSVGLPERPPVAGWPIVASRVCGIVGLLLVAAGWRGRGEFVKESDARCL